MEAYHLWALPRGVGLQSAVSWDNIHKLQGHDMKNLGATQVQILCVVAFTEPGMDGRPPRQAWMAKLRKLPSLQ